jgi:organic hydroperoxide reductase OsmC/OhrA
MKKHEYDIALRWTGNRGTGTSGYNVYGRDHEISSPPKSVVLALSSDPHFHGDASRYNPEDLLVASLSSCHLLSYLHLCAVNQVVVTAYEDNASGTMEEDELSARFTEVTLRPRVTISPESDTARAMELHEEAARLCFIARSVNFPVRHEPVICSG